MRSTVLLAALALTAVAPTAATSATAHAAGDTTCRGAVFADLDADGNRREALGRDGVPDDLEPGIAGVEVTITDRFGAVTSTSTDGRGVWETRVTAARFPIRLEFQHPAGFVDSVTGPSNGTAVQFVGRPDDCAGPTGSVGLVDPLQFCRADAAIVTTCHLRADRDEVVPDDPVVRVVAATARDDRSDDAVLDEDWLSEPTVTLATLEQVGTVHGLATTPDGRVFAAAFVKRHTTLRSLANPDGNPTAIYELAEDERPRLLTVLDPTAEDPHDDDGTTDAAVMDDVLRTGVGDLELSADGSVLYAVDLGRRALVSLDPDDGALIGATPLDGIRLGVTSCGISADRPYGDLRPFGLGTGPDGELLVGVVCSAESTVDALPVDDTRPLPRGATAVGAGDESKLVGYVFELVDDRFVERLSWPLAGRRGETWSTEMLAHEAAWHPWVDEYPFLAEHVIVSYPQPVIADLAVDDDGNLLIGLADRWAHQTAPHSEIPSADGPRAIDESIPAGDLQRACPTADGWVIEGSDGCDGGIGDGWEFFDGDRYGWHAETPLGSLAIAAGREDVISTQFDPVPADGTWQSGGLVWHDTTTGEATDGLRVYDGRNARPDGTFENAAGVGDVELMCGAVPIVLGGRLWHDADGDGVPDPTERAIADVPIELFDANGRRVAEGRTDLDGRYQFDGRDVDRGLGDGKRYTLVVPDDAFRSGPFGPGGAWAGLRPTQSDGELGGRIEREVVAGDDPTTSAVEPPIQQRLDIAMTDQYDLALHAELARRGDVPDVLGLDVLVVNQGSRPAGALTVTSRVPDGSELVEAGDGSLAAVVDGDHVIWTVPDEVAPGPGQTLRLPIRVRVAPQGDADYVYAAELTTDSGADDDSEPGNAFLDHPASLRPIGAEVPIDRFGSSAWEDDSGVLTIRLSTIAGTVWFDDDRDAERDLAGTTVERPAAGVDVRLVRDDGVEYARTTTDDDGWYEFPLLDSGTYRVELATSNFGAGGALGGHDVVVEPDGDLVSADVGYRTGPIVLDVDRDDDVEVSNIGVATGPGSPWLGNGARMLVGPGIVLGMYGVLNVQRRRNRFGTGDLGRVRG